MANSGSGKGKGFGTIRKLPSGKFQAFYTHDYQKVTAPNTFVAKGHARDWLANEQVAISSGKWVAPKDRKPVVSENHEFVAYVNHYLKSKRKNGNPIQESTKDLYRKLVKHQLGGFHGRSVKDLTSQEIDRWFQSATAGGKRTSSANAYKLLRAVLNFAKREGVVDANNCNIPGAQNASSGRKQYTPPMEEVIALAKVIDPQFRTLTLVGAYGVMRFGELAGLQKGDFKLVQDPESGEFSYHVHIQRQVKYFASQFEVGDPKSKEGNRVNVLNPSITDEVKAHLSGVKRNADHVFTDFNGDYMRNDFYARRLEKAVDAMGLKGKGFTVHSLRHAGATAYANKGANVAEIQAVLGDSSPTAALGYIKATNRAVKLAASLPRI
ncbi:MAG: hypothetical protein RL343_250 [Actinomycetota bacterium]|jgi:integrase